jgi:hypothetical protein
MWIPAGFAHGFLVLSETAEFLYKVTDYRAAEHERCIRWDDPQLGIDWPLQGSPILSAKDAEGLLLAAAELPALKAATKLPRRMSAPQRITRLKRKGGFGVSAALPASVPPPMP